MKAKGILNFIKNVLKTLVYGSGILLIALSIIACTRVPYDVHRWLGRSEGEFTFKPEVLVLLGGGGMPSESNLIRLYYAVSAARQFPEAKIIIAHPADKAVAWKMGEYLIMQGIDKRRIFLVTKGTNTREQALEINKRYNFQAAKKIAVITSPENMYRTVKTFKKAGLVKTGGISSFETAVFVKLKYDHHKIGGGKYVPDVSNKLSLRYNFWNYFKLEITCIREFFAIGYYWMNGWI